MGLWLHKLASGFEIEPYLQIYNVDKRILEVAHELIGGRIKWDNTCYRLALCGYKVFKVLDEVKEFLIVKRELAHIVIGYILQRTRSPSKSYTTNDVSFVEKAHQLQLRANKKSLKHLEEFRIYVQK